MFGFCLRTFFSRGVIASGQAKRVLLITSETTANTSTRKIDLCERFLVMLLQRRLSTLVKNDACKQFQFGTDGSGADTLIVNDGGARLEADAIKPRHRKRWKSRLYMDGPSLISFTVTAIPELVRQMLNQSQTSIDNIDLLLMHQATRKMLEQLQMALKVDENKLPIRMMDCGNTVSSTLPILIDELRADGSLRPGKQTMLIGFGVGWSWAGCMWRDTFEPWNRVY